jgi:hypothetical protein
MRRPGGLRLFFEFMPNGNGPRVTIEEEIFPNGVFAPGSFPFTANIDLNLPPGTGTGGTAVVQVTGTDANGGMVDVSSDTLVVTDSNTKKPAFSCVPNANTLCLLPGGRFQVNVNWADFNGNTGPGMVTDGQRFSDGGWFSFVGSSAPLNPNGFDAYVQLFDECANNGHFWIFLNGATAAGTTDIEVTLTVTDTETNQTRDYGNPLGTPVEAITDTSAFATCP